MATVHEGAAPLSQRLKLSELTVNVRRLTFALVLGLVTASCAPAALDQGSERSGSSLGEQRSDAGAVVIVASWVEGGAVAVRVAMDTHSVDLDGFDLKDLARVRLDGGAWLAPSAWDAPEGGHHREGGLAFAALDSMALASARVIELEVRDVAVPYRMLRWERP